MQRRDAGLERVWFGRRPGVEAIAVPLDVAGHEAVEPEHEQAVVIAV
jgi:hypothetical protein